jgi:sulfur-oxidizing protein SoxY
MTTTRLHRRSLFRWLAPVAIAALAPLIGSPAWGQLKTGDNPEASEPWKKVRASLFGDRSIDQDSKVVMLDAPKRAEDAAIVPIGVRVAFPQTPERYVKRLWLVVDNNPSPISAILQLTPDSGRADFETRLRIDEYTFVRAVAETNDGKLHMATNFVKASGGCSAPPGKDPQAALASLGKMKLRIDDAAPGDKAVAAQLMISHPNHSGMAMDQYTRQFTPAHFVRQVEITQGGKPILSADLDFSLSENPNLRFYFVPRGNEPLKVEVSDTKDLRWEMSAKVDVSTASR